MKQIFLPVLFMFTSTITLSQAISQKKQAIRYSSILYNNAMTVKNAGIAVMITILKGSPDGTVIYSERHVTKTDTSGAYHIEIGAGKPATGQFDSIIWSDGIYYLKTEADPMAGTNYTIKHNALIRIPSELNNVYDQGTVSASEHKDWGEWRYRNIRNKRPGLVTIDLSTSYANLAYPANTYPIYRHYEWCDPDRDGIGNSFCISFSENTSNDFIENTMKLGEVRLYSTPFQELSISSANNEVIVTISKPVPVSNLGETYAIKGPWKFIYYIEW